MGSLHGRTAIVTGGTASIGALIARTLLERGATVVVPSRSAQRLAELRDYIGRRAGEDHLSRLVTMAGDLRDDAGAASLSEQIIAQTSSVDAVVASLGDFVTAPTVLGASTADLQRAVDGYLLSHHRAARTFLPLLQDSGGTYLFLQGPLAFDIYPGLATDLISIATAGQHMLFRALANEVDGGQVTVIELVLHALIRNRETQQGSQVRAEAVGPFTTDLLFSPRDGRHGQSIHLTSDQVAEVGGITGT